MRRVEPPLLERDREQAVLASVVAGLLAGRPAVVTVTGWPGAGQNGLLRWATGLAEERGLRVLRAQATLAERDLRHGAVLQLLTPVAELVGHALRALIEQDRPERLPALAELLRAVRGHPTLLVVEDTQWLDPASLHWLQALVRRLSAGAPVALLVSSSGLSAEGPDWRTAAEQSPAAVVTTELALPPLSAAGVAAAVELVCGAAGEEAFITEAAESTAGIPAVLHDTLCVFADNGFEPVTARVPELRTVAGAVIGDHTSRVLNGLAGEAVAVLRALAVCGDLLDFPLACTLAGQRSMRESRLRAMLDAAGLTVSEGAVVRFRCPVAKARVLQEMPADERADLHARAAELAHRAAVDEEDIAEILLRAPALGARWVIPVLRRSFSAALRRGDHGRAVAHLSRALEEPLDPVGSAELQLELADAEVLVAPEAGDRRLGRLARTDSHVFPGLRARAVDLGLARGDDDWGRRTAAEALPAARGAERDGLLALFWLADQSRQDDNDLMPPEIPDLPDRPTAPAQAGVRAWQLAVRGDDLRTTVALARTALAREHRKSALLMPRLMACRALYLTDDCGEAEAELDALLAEVRRDHARAAAARVLAVRSELYLRCGRLDAAERDAAAVERAMPMSSWHAAAAAYVMSVRIAVALESGRFEQARALAAAPVKPGAEDHVAYAYVLFARARVASSDERWTEARELLMESGRRLLRRQHVNPALIPWRSLAGRVCHLLGEHEESARLTDEELELARRWGAPSALGLAELCAGPLDGEDRLVRVREAMRTLRGAPARMIYAWGLVELACTEMGQGNRQAAARLVAELSRFTTTYPSSRLAGRVRSLTGELERPAEPAPAPAVPRAWASLTEAEQLTATFAGRGHGNREIAELLSVTRRTVELRLSNSYKKLRISGRKELRALVRAMEGY